MFDENRAPEVEVEVDCTDLTMDVRDLLVQHGFVSDQPIPTPSLDPVGYKIELSNAGHPEPGDQYKAAILVIYDKLLVEKNDPRRDHIIAKNDGLYIARNPISEVQFDPHDAEAHAAAVLKEYMNRQAAS